MDEMGCAQKEMYVWMDEGTDGWIGGRTDGRIHSASVCRWKNTSHAYLSVCVNSKSELLSQIYYTALHLHHYKRESSILFFIYKMFMNTSQPVF